MAQAVPSSSNYDIENRIQKIVESRQHATMVTLNPHAKAMLGEYFTEITHALLEHASILAKHRGSDTVDSVDVFLALGRFNDADIYIATLILPISEKKLDIVVPGSRRKHPLYKSVYRAKSLKSSSGGDSEKVESTDSRKGGTKRKGAPVG